MLQERSCERCNKAIEPPKATYKQSRYCSSCAKIKKRESDADSDSRTEEQRRQYIRSYMRGYRRAHPGLSTPYVQRHRKRKRALPTTA